MSVTRPRVVVLTDFPPLDVIPVGAGAGPPEKRSDPDDIQSMVRFLLYANDLEVEGLVASAATVANLARKQSLVDILEVYGKVETHLRKRDPRYPTAKSLKARTWQGRSGTYGKPAHEITGAGRDSEASEAIIALVDRPDMRPIWFCIWGGPADLAQALWKVQATRSAEALECFVSKLRVYLIGKQDGTAQWLLDTFPSLFVILNEKSYFGMFWDVGSEPQLADLAWIERNIRQGNGPLGALYPKSGFNPAKPGQQEGDTPSFLHLVSATQGLNNPEKPDQPGWGGQFVRRDPTRNHWFDSPEGGQTILRWRAQMQADFAKRANWMAKK